MAAPAPFIACGPRFMFESNPMALFAATALAVAELLDEPSGTLRRGWGGKGQYVFLVTDFSSKGITVARRGFKSLARQGRILVERYGLMVNWQATPHKGNKQAACDF